jgi:type I restriction enzyme S subunit
MGTLLLVVRGMILAKAIPTALSGVETTYNQDIKAFRPNGRATPRFVRLCLQHQETELLKVVNTATHGTKKLDQATIDEILVPLPDLETQEIISEMISRLDSATVSYGAEHLRLSELRKNLIADLVSGRVRVPA